MSGIQSATLINLVKNTAPFLWSQAESVSNAHRRYVQILKDAELAPESVDEDLPRYYELCLAAHFSTVATFVPTDVDTAIRYKLWLKVHHDLGFTPLWNLVKEFQTWDESFVSKRFHVTAGGEKISGHQGEWFSIAVGAYVTALKVAPDQVQEVRESIEAMVTLHEKILTELETDFLENPTPEACKNLCMAIAMTAHNLGDLDRMIEEWKLGEHDVLRRRVFRAGHEDARSPREILVRSGKIYQLLLASENHRNFALREPKAIRKSSRFLLPSGPFFDDWGKELVKAFQEKVFTERELREVIEALIEGWVRLNPKSIYTSQGYARALRGIQITLPKISAQWDLLTIVPPILAKELREGGLATLLQIPQKQFEAEWVKKLVRACREGMGN